MDSEEAATAEGTNRANLLQSFTNIPSLRQTGEGHDSFDTCTAALRSRHRSLDSARGKRQKMKSQNRIQGSKPYECSEAENIARHSRRIRRTSFSSFEEVKGCLITLSRQLTLCRKPGHGIGYVK